MYYSVSLATPPVSVTLIPTPVLTPFSRILASNRILGRGVYYKDGCVSYPDTPMNRERKGSAKGGTVCVL